MKFLRKLFERNETLRVPSGESQSSLSKEQEVNSENAKKNAEDAAIESARQWASSMVIAGNFKALAAMCVKCNRDNWYEFHQAKIALEKAGASAVDALIEQLSAEHSDYLIDLLLKAEDPRAVPILKEKLAKISYLSAFTTKKLEEFISRFDTNKKREMDDRRRVEEETRAKVRDAVKSYGDHEMINVLRQLCRAYATSSGDAPEIRRLEPIATAIGERLNERGGIQEMRRIFEHVQMEHGARTLDMHWGGIGEWLG